MARGVLSLAIRGGSTFVARGRGEDQEVHRRTQGLWSWPGTTPLDASSGEQNRHRLSRAGNWRMNHMMHIAAITQLRLDTDGRVYFRR